MKKLRTYLFLLAIPATLMTSCSDEPINDDGRIYDYERYGLDRPVKSLTVKIYDAECKGSRVVKGDLKSKYSINFNAVGNEKLKKRYTGDGELIGYHEFTYDSNDMLIKKLDYDGNDNLECCTTIEYDGDKLVKQVETYYSEDESGSYENEFVYTHTWDGERLVEQIEEWNGILSAVTEYTSYTKTSHEWTTDDKIFGGEWLCCERFNDSGRLIMYCEDDEVGEVKWNGKNLPVYCKNMTIINNTCPEFSSELLGVSLYMEYEYDEYGNWITQTIYMDEDEDPLLISEREIKY